MSKLLRVTELQGEPEIGKFYLVPCIQGRGHWIPVIGPPHEDADHLGFAHRHYHKDVRFFDAWLMQFEDEKSVGFLGEVLWEPHNPTELQKLGAVVWKRKKCARRMPDFPLLIGTSPHVDPRFLSLEKAYEGKRLDLACLRCPHRGLPLASLPAESGVVVCSGHGLAWNIETGELVSRYHAAHQGLVGDAQ